MRTFDRTAAGNHALFDACLVHLFENSSNWTKAKWHGNTPITLEHFRYDAQRKLAACLQQVPELKEQDLSDRRVILQHIAHWWTILSAKYLHTWQEPVEEMIVALRTNLHLVTQHRKIVLQDEQHPLQKNPMKRFDTFVEEDPPGSHCLKEKRVSFVPAKPQDTLITRYIVGPHPENDRATEHTQTLLRHISPFLMELDLGQVESTLFALRQQLRSLLKGKRSAFSPSLRHAVTEAIVADWQQQYFEPDDQSLFSTIEEEVRSEMATFGIEVDDVFRLSSSQQLEYCFTLPLAQELSSTMRDRLIRRRPVLEYIVQQAIQEKDGPLLNKLYDTMLVMMQKLDLKYGDIGHLGLLTYAETCQDPELFAKILG